MSWPTMVRSVLQFFVALFFWFCFFRLFVHVSLCVGQGAGPWGECPYGWGSLGIPFSFPPTRSSVEVGRTPRRLGESGNTFLPLPLSFFCCFLCFRFFVLLVHVSPCVGQNAIETVRVLRGRLWPFPRLQENQNVLKSITVRN